MFALLLASLCLATPAVTLTDAEVLIPWKDFEELYRRGLAPETAPEPAPRAYTLNRASYSGKVVGAGEDAYAIIQSPARR